MQLWARLRVNRRPHFILQSLRAHASPIGNQRHRQAVSKHHPDRLKSASELQLQLLSERLNITIQTKLARSAQSSLRRTFAWFAPSYLTTVETPFLEMRESISALTQYSTPCSKASKQEISSSSLRSTIKPYARRYLRSERKREFIPNPTKQPKAEKAKYWSPSLFECSKEEMTRTTAIFHRSHRCLVHMHLYLF